MTATEQVHALYDIALQTLEGERTTLRSFAGNVLLIVNTASKCGFTPQYKELQQLHDRFEPLGFSVLGFPCNQFGYQEPGDSNEIREFCTQRFQVSFPLFAKVDVNGSGAHPLFSYLKEKAPGLLGVRAIKWNFTKFLISREGDVLARYAPTTTPTELVPDIERALTAKKPV